MAAADVSSSSEASVVLAEHHHEAPLADFIREVWDANATTESVMAARRESARFNLADPGVPFPTYLFLHKGRVAGHVTTRPTRVWAGGRETPAYWLKGLHVLAAYRNGPVGLRLIQTAARELQPAMAMVVQPAACKLFTALGFRDYGVLPNFVRVLNGSKVVRAANPERLGLRLDRVSNAALRIARIRGVDRIAGGLLGAGLAIWTRARLPRTVKPRIINRPSAPDLDTLWKLARQSLRFAPVRSADYLFPRYASLQDVPYDIIGATLRGDFRAMCVLRHPRQQGDPRLAGLRVATIAELVQHETASNASAALLAECCRRGRALGADALLCTTSHAATARTLLRNGFVRLPGNVHFLARGLPDPDITIEDALLTRGDSDADEVF